MCNVKNNSIKSFSGTHWGKLYILDALGHIMPQLEEKFTKHSHSVAVSQISVDHPGKLKWDAKSWEFGVGLKKNSIVEQYLSSPFLTQVIIPKFWKNT